MDKKITRSSMAEGGFTLTEVMIAIVIFATFAVIYVMGQGTNVLDSSRIRNNTMLYTLAGNMLNEVIIDPPDFKESLTSIKRFTPFENYPGYSYAIEMKKIELPSFEGLTGEEEDPQETNNLIRKNIYNQMKDNFEKAVWQVQVTVQHKETQDTYSLASWIMNNSASMRFNY